MKPTKIKSEEPEQQQDLDEFEQFVKAIWSVPKEEVDQLSNPQSPSVKKPKEKKREKDN